MTCNKQTMKNLNMKALLRSFLPAGPVSQKKLQQSTGLDKCTVSVLINELKNQGVVAAAGNGTSSRKGGRKEQYLDLDRQRITGLGIALRDKRLHFGLFDLQGSLLWEASFPVARNHSTVWAPLILKTAGKIAEKCSRQGRIFLGAGFSLGCLYNPDRNELVRITDGEEKNLLLDPLLNSRLPGISLFTDDFPNAMAVGEMWFGEAKGLRDFLYLQLFPLRITVVMDGKIRRGPRFLAGETGKSSAARRFMDESADKTALFKNEFFLDWLFDLTLYFDPQKIIISSESAPSPAPEAFIGMNGFIRDRYRELYPGLESPDCVGPGGLSAAERIKGAAALVFQNYFHPDLINPKKETICRQTS